jgi:hypothetical protein
MNRDNTHLWLAGEVLFGERWQAPLAGALGVSERTMRRWVAGTSPVPDGVWADIVDLIVERHERTVALRQMLEEGRGSSH